MYNNNNKYNSNKYKSKKSYNKSYAKNNASRSKTKSSWAKILSLAGFIIVIIFTSLFIDAIADKLPFKLPWRDNSHVITIDELIGMDIPGFSGSPYVIVDDNKPDEFAGSYDKNDFLEIGVHYSELDELGRVGVAWGILDSSLMPTNEREGILETKPSGWNPAKYDDIIEDGFLYNRCHLIGFQLTGEQDNPRNLMTGTRYFNIEGMLPFENQVAGYIRREDGRVFYRITPLFQGNERLARYVRMEAYSLDDKGIAVCFDVLIYNVQPGITIDYATGESRRSN
ncbi:MAG: DNA/RNA non-specific endonuclease [Firmicutes bacterium]|nr:DNA/RNA non-specific endonuclease [Bacillota bacterium]